MTMPTWNLINVVIPVTMIVTIAADQKLYFSGIVVLEVVLVEVRD